LVRTFTLFLALVFLPTYVFSSEAKSPLRTITVQGVGTVQVKPDIANVRAGATTRDATTEAALSKNNAIMAKLHKLARDFGVEERDIQTSSFRVNPVYGKREHNRTRPIVGYEVSNAVSIKVRELSKLGRFLDTLARDGANRLSGISFGIGDSETHQNEARARAVKNAYSRAKTIAKAANIELGDILEIREGSISRPGPVPYPAARMMASESVPVAKGEMSITARLTIIYEID